GDLGFNFDFVSGFASLVDTGDPIVPAIAIGDTAQDGIRTDDVSLQFSGFGQNDRFQFQVDIDLDSSNTAEDFRTVYFNNGVAPNARITVTFQAGAEAGTLSIDLPDDPLVGDPQVFDFSASGATTSIPEPSSIAVFLIYSIGNALRRRR
ncbi:MAG: hypothetical protein AAGC97_17705, partial [Planctomycetota bacterium]